MQQERSSVAVPRSTVLDLNQIRVDMGRREGRTVTLAEVIGRLIEAYRQQVGAGARRAG
jgi:hypothetical protein